MHIDAKIKFREQRYFVDFKTNVSVVRTLPNLQSSEVEEARDHHDYLHLITVYWNSELKIHACFDSLYNLWQSQVGGLKNIPIMRNNYDLIHDQVGPTKLIDRERPPRNDFFVDIRTRTRDLLLVNKSTYKVLTTSPPLLAGMVLSLKSNRALASQSSDSKTIHQISGSKLIHQFAAKILHKLRTQMIVLLSKIPPSPTETEFSLQSWSESVVSSLKVSVLVDRYLFRGLGLVWPNLTDDTTSLLGYDATTSDLVQ
ncbi:hypothetical protein Syun_012513 [Stephania yunnanensis]|uniref:Uncharacterized protein n=1 Tax=Stephania yunnanensis TaxID=152371 RepID=A0AAP0JZJ3_9MAGN